MKRRSGLYQNADVAVQQAGLSVLDSTEAHLRAEIAAIEAQQDQLQFETSNDALGRRSALASRKVSVMNNLIALERNRQVTQNALRNAQANPLGDVPQAPSVLR
jgi:hypothetical protein